MVNAFPVGKKAELEEADGASTGTDDNSIETGSISSL
jgi:hypothetical protein